LPASFTTSGTAPSPGTIQSISWNFNSFGWFDYTHVTRVAIAGTLLTVNLKEDYTYKSYSLEYWNQTTSPTTSAVTGYTATSYTQETRRERINEFGRLDGVLVCLAPILTGIDVVDVVTVDNAEQKVTESYYFNKEKADLPTASSTLTTTLSTEISVDPRPNRFGLFDCVKRTVETYSPLGEGVTSAAWTTKGEKRAYRMESGGIDIWVVEQKYRHHTQTVCITLGAALTAIHDGNEGSSYQNAGHGWYVATHISEDSTP